ncbi:Branched-chain amino acid transport ATP-binding protein LivG (TC 3.A.1.4.1) [plant metagenome]|uniref:Branched-chain amino acid transport ATP-binding protein LivG (TC 3.A.1.4.1) n=1 Tax=plant metagenome TaxID=1297885 RepID=A0A484UWB1_9ZZZZ
MAMLLAVRGLACRYGGIQALSGLDLELAAGEVLGLIGPNGSGKSTTLDLLAGVRPSPPAAVQLAGQPIGHLPAHRRARLGLRRTFQEPRLVAALTVRENLAAALPVGRGWPWRRTEGMPWLEACGLAHEAGRLAGELSFGARRRLELARALSPGPRLVLLDEPAAGLTEEEVGMLGETILRIRRAGVGVVLVDHVMRLVMAVSDRLAVLERGCKIAEGSPAAVSADPRVRRVYLGEGT